MNKIILKDGTVLEFIQSLGIDNINVKNKTVDELEEILTKDNLSEVQFTYENGEVYGKYDNNLTLISLTKNYITNEIIMKLKETITQ